MTRNASPQNVRLHPTSPIHARTLMTHVGNEWGHDTCEGFAERGPSHHVNPATFGPSVGLPVRTYPLGPSVELPGGHETCEGYAEMGGATPCQRTHWGLWWSSLWGHE